MRLNRYDANGLGGPAPMPSCMATLSFLLRNLLILIIMTGILSASSVRIAECAELIRQDDRVLVLHAGGTVQLRCPPDWYIAESPAGREIRLVLAPQRPASWPEPVSDGMWLAVHVRPRNAHQMNSVDLQNALGERLASTTPNARYRNESQPIQLSDQRALKQEFVVRRTATQSNEVYDAAQGSHVLVVTQWGLVEIHAEAPMDLFQQRRRQFDEVLASLVLRTPTVDQTQPVVSIQDAESILGSWKAFRSRMRLFADGRFVITPDRPIDVDQVPNDRQSTKGIAPLVGRFRSQNDLLFVTWADGSLLNLRWRLSDGQLLLTDHDGQISQLRRILE